MGMMQQILQEISQVLNKIKEAELVEIVEQINAANRVFVIGEGRSGFMAKSFAMRLMHLGINSYVIGETITPSIAEGDVLVAISGSGSTHHVVWTAQKARALGVQVIALTTNGDSELARHANRLLVVPAATKFRLEGERDSIQPLGSLFDQSAHVIFDTICLMKMQEVSQGAAFKAHSNLES